MKSLQRQLLVMLMFVGYPLSTSATTLPTCDPNNDPWGCECDTGGGFRCDLVEDNTFSHLSDYTQWDTGNWVTTTFNQTSGMYEVTANLDVSPSKGVFPVLDNAGDWTSPEEVAAFVGAILQVPLTGSGKLQPFVYRQIGSSYLVDLDNQNVYPGDEMFWWGLIRDPAGLINIQTSVLEDYLGQEFCSTTTTQTVVGQYHSLEQQNSICYTEVGCHGPNCDPSEHSATTVSIHAFSRPLSVFGSPYHIFYESFPVEYAVCDQNVCTFSQPRIELINSDPMMIRVIQVVSNLSVGVEYSNNETRIFYSDKGTQSTSPTSALVFRTSKTKAHYPNFQEFPFNSYCTSSLSENDFETLNNHLEKSLPFASNLPACPRPQL